MISRAHLVEPFIIMEALELLAEAAANEKHKEAQFYRKVYRTCRKYEESKELVVLLVKLFGAQDDKKVQGAVADWLNGLKTEGKSAHKKVDKSASESETQVQGEQAHVPRQVPYIPAPFMPYSPYGFPPPFSPRVYSNAPKGRRSSRGRGRGKLRGLVLIARRWAIWWQTAQRCKRTKGVKFGHVVSYY